MPERAAGLLKHEVINLISSEKSHSGRECPVDRTGTSEDQEEAVWLDSGTWVKEGSKLASFIHSFMNSFIYQVFTRSSPLSSLKSCVWCPSGHVLRPA